MEVADPPALAARLFRLFALPHHVRCACGPRGAGVSRASYGSSRMPLSVGDLGLVRRVAGSRSCRVSDRTAEANARNFSH